MKQSQKELSLRYFSQVSELNEIQESFSLKSIDQQITSRDLQTEFELLRALTETKKHRMMLRSNSVIENKKNRYPEQSICTHDLIESLTFQDDEEGLNKKHEDYINANIFSFKIPDLNLIEVQQQKDNNLIIISQAPLQTTVEDFTKIIVDNQIQCVVMLCNYVENNKTRCFQYLESSNWHQQNLVKLNQQSNSEQEVATEVRTINIETLFRKQTHQIQHIFYKNWPDKNVPTDKSSLIPALKEAIKYKKILIHCSAGLGRSGVFAALWEILKTVQFKNSDIANQKISIFGTVRKIREKRFGAVQNTQQYRFLYEFMSKYLKRSQQLI